MNVVREIQKLNEKELARGTTQGSWHDQYKDSAWVYVGGLPYELTEGDVICVMSQWGEIEDLHLVREKDTGKSKGFAFVKYEDQKSTILAVDNFNGVKLLDRVLRVDHKEKYALPKELLKKEEEMEKEALEKGMPVPAGEGAKWKPGHAYEGKELATEHNIKQGVDLFAPPKDSDEEASSDEESEEEVEEERGGGRSSDGGKMSKEEKKARKKEKKARKKEEKKRKKEERKRHRDEEDKGGRGDKRRREDEDSKRPRGEDREKDDAPWEQVAEIEPLPMLPPEDDGSSWRGRMDPSMKGSEGRGIGRGGGGGGRGGPRGGGSMFGRAYSGNNKRSDMSGIAGMNRRR